MSDTDRPQPGDRARVSIAVPAEPSLAFQLFTEEIDRWWLRGPKYRRAGARRGIIHLEPHVGGRLFESYDAADGPRVVESGRVLVWEPPERLAFEWRARNFGPGETTEVEVLFRASGRGTLVTVTHYGFAALRPDHPVRHGLDVAAFIRSMGMWWGELMSSLREHAEQRFP